MNGNERSGKKDSRRSIGLYGEREALDYLAGKGYAILHTNWRCRSGELDIVAQSGPTIIIVEVRTRRAGGRFGTAVESVDARKQFQVRATAEVYLAVNKRHDSRVRFDVIAITLAEIAADPVVYETIELKHVESAF